MTETGRDSGVEELFRVRDRVVVITGASSGMGRDFALALARAGARVVAAARRLDRLMQLCSPGLEILPVRCDVAVEDDLHELLTRTREQFGPVEVLVNNAGFIHGAVPAQDESREELERTIAVNLTAPARLSALVYPDMRARGDGSIINMSSISGLVGIGRLPQASYAASKAGLVGLTRELAVQWARDGVRVNAVAAGYVTTEMTEGMFDVPRLAEWVDRNTPLPHRGEPRDLLGTLFLLASPAGRFITGQTIVVDGGWTAR